MARPRRRGAVAGAALAAGGIALSGCEDSAAGFAAGIGEAIVLLLFVGLILPAALMGLVALVIVGVRRRRARSAPPPWPPRWPPPPPPGPPGPPGPPPPGPPPPN